MALRRRRLLTAWVLVRFVAPLVALVALQATSGDLLGAWLTRSTYGHGLAKNLLGPWVTLVLRAPVGLGALLGALVLALLLPTLRGPVWFGVAGAAAIVAALGTDAWVPGLVIGLALLFANLWPTVPEVWRRLAWVPGLGLFLPAPLFRTIGVPRPLATGVAAVWLALVWFVVDAAVTASARSDQVWAWPEARLDPRITVLARAPEGVVSDYQEVDVTPERILVVAETSRRLLAFPRRFDGPPAFAGLRPWWGPNRGLTLNSESDPSTGTTWFLDGPSHIAAVRWEGAQAVPVGRSVTLPRAFDHAATLWVAERNQLILVTINVTEEVDPPAMVLVDTPALDHATTHPLQTSDGRRVPHIRDVAWIPTLGRLVLAPDFGTRLYLADPDTGICTPWVEVPTLNGRMVWSPRLQRLFIAVPSRFSVLVIDPAKGVVERTIPTQPGVRPLAIDADRGLLLTASVVTGSVWVQRLDDGRLVDSFRTILPMVREMALLPEEGIAIVSTWTQLYAIPYAAP